MIHIKCMQIAFLVKQKETFNGRLVLLITIQQSNPCVRTWKCIVIPFLKYWSLVVTSFIIGKLRIKESQ